MLAVIFVRFGKDCLLSANICDISKKNPLLIQTGWYSHFLLYKNTFFFKQLLSICDVQRTQLSGIQVRFYTVMSHIRFRGRPSYFIQRLEVVCNISHMCCIINIEGFGWFFNDYTLICVWICTKGNLMHFACRGIPHSCAHKTSQFVSFLKW